jgi:SAM-dependent methyltransferase
MSYTLEQCPACESTAQHQLCVTRDRHYGIKGEYRVVQCDACELVFLNPMYEDSELAPLYPPDYYAYQDQFQEPGATKQFIKKLVGYEFNTKDPAFDRPGKILDVGCGSGWFLARMRNQGWQPYGVEINKAAAELARELAGLSIFNGTLLDAHFPGDSFDYVRLQHSFEHMSRPNETLQEIFRVLKPDGCVFIGVPNYASFYARIFGRYWWYLGIPVHPFNYSVKSLETLLTRNRFQIQTVTFNSNYIGLLGSLQIFRNRSNGNRSTEGTALGVLPFKILGLWMAKILDCCHLGDAVEIVARKSFT